MRGKKEGKTVSWSLSLLLLPDLVVTEFVEMRLVEVNGAGWCLQLVSNRRGPGHLIICLFIARRRTNRSCRNEAQAENTAQRSHTRQEQPRARLCAGGRVQREKDAWGYAGPALIPWLPQETRRAAALDSSPPPPGAPPSSLSLGAKEAASPPVGAPLRCRPAWPLQRSFPRSLPSAWLQPAWQVQARGAAAGCWGEGACCLGSSLSRPRV